MRIVSLLPSTTEIVCRLGLEHHLVGRSHECDFPAQITHLPILTEPKFKENRDSSEIDKQIKSLLQNGLSVFKVNAEKLSELNPDIILTQDHCEVCAVSISEVEDAVKKYTESNCEVISVSPVNLKDIFNSFKTIGIATGTEDSADNLINETKERLNIIRNTVCGEVKKSVVTVEWIDPLMTAGNWVPELIELAGGEDLLGEAGEHSPWIDWNSIKEADPEFLLILPCGYSIRQTKKELDILTENPGWNDLRAVQNDNVYIMDGNQYFNRPGPRIFESTRIIAEILHPHLFKPTMKNSGWKQIKKHDLTSLRA